MSEEQPLALALREHLAQLVGDIGLAELVPRPVLEEGLADLELGIGQLLADVERAARRGVPLREAVRAHDTYPYLCRFHGHFNDALVMNLPEELIPLLRRFVRMPPSAWTGPMMDDLCVIARSPRARPDERALARLMIFEGIKLNLQLTAWRTNGRFEGLGGDSRDLDAIADGELGKLLDIPLAEDALESYRPFQTVVVAAMVRMRKHVDKMWAAQALIEELRLAAQGRADLELLLRDADPVDAAVLRNYFDRAPHHQPIPVAQLPLEHPLVLAGQTENSLNQRASRAIKKLKKNRRAIALRPKPITMADLILEMETTHA